MQSLSKIKEELTMGQEKLRSNVDTINRQLSELQTVCSSLEEEQGRLEKMLPVAGVGGRRSRSRWGVYKPWKPFKIEQRIHEGFSDGGY